MVKGRNVSLVDGHVDNAEHCVCCGRIIPEGQQICEMCRYKYENTNYTSDTDEEEECWSDEIFEVFVD